MAKERTYSPIECSRCGKTTERTGPAQKMCASCKEETAAASKALWQQRFRAKKAGRPLPALPAVAVMPALEKPVATAPVSVGGAVPEQSPKRQRGGAIGEPCRSIAADSSRQLSIAIEKSTAAVPVALPLDIVQVREGLCQISGRHGLIAQRALAADTALASLQEAMA